MNSANFISLAGIFVFLGIAYLLSHNRKAINLRMVGVGLGLQLALALLVLGVPALGFNGPLKIIFSFANDLIVGILAFSQAGAKFMFGSVADSEKMGFIFAFQVLPVIIFMSTLMAALYYVGVMQLIVGLFARVMRSLLGTSGAESLSASANIFFGQTEAPLVIKPFIARMTNSELFCVMVGGMATVAGSVLAAFTGLLVERIPNIAGHLLTASVLSAPAALVIAKMMIPEDGRPETANEVPEEYKKTKTDTNFIEAIARGASEGVGLAINVAAMLIAFIALIALADAALLKVGEWVQFANWGSSFVPEQLRVAEKPAELSFSLVFGWIFAPLAWIMGIEWSEAAVAGVLLGQKVVLNEFVAYINLSQLMNNLSDRTVIILSYALCGFANFSSIGIQIGGIGSIAPNRKGDLARLGIKSVIGGSLAAFITASIAGLLI